MYTITFYSVKAVGRTLALVNVAGELARRGRRVLVVDFDLEAPALDTAGRLRPNAWHPGVVEYVTDYVNTGQEPAIREYLYDAGPVGEKGGRIWVMPAGGRDQDYRGALARLDWLGLYQSHDGFEFMNRTKAQWEQLPLHPVYVLIDCPAGRTNVEGICTRQLPDAVVALFFPDVQNLAGLGSVCQAIRTETARGRPKPIALHFIMSNVPVVDDEEDDGQQLSRRRDDFARTLNIPKLAATLHHCDGLVTVDQRPLVLDRPNVRLAREYRELVDALIVHNPEDREGGLLFLKQMEAAYARGPAGFELKEEEERLGRFRNQHGNDAEFLVKVAHCQISGGRFADAERVLDQVLENRQTRLPEALLERARCHLEQKNKKDAVADLQAYLAFPGLEDEPILAALRRLHALAPEQFDDLRNRPEVQALLKDEEWRWQGEGVGGFEEEGPPWYEALEPLDRLRVQVLLDPEEHDSTAWWRMTPEQRLRWTIRNLEGKIGELSTRVPVKEQERNWNAFALACAHFDLARAYWRATGRMPADLCKRGLDYHARVADDFRDNQDYLVKEYSDYRQNVALALWATGRIREALKEIHDEEVSAEDDPPDTLYESVWRDREEVTREQFLADLRAIKDLIRDTSDIHPAFLG